MSCLSCSPFSSLNILTSILSCLPSYLLHGGLGCESFWVLVLLFFSSCLLKLPNGWQAVRNLLWIVSNSLSHYFHLHLNILVLFTLSTTVGNGTKIVKIVPGPQALPPYFFCVHSWEHVLSPGEKREQETQSWQWYKTLKHILHKVQSLQPVYVNYIKTCDLDPQTAMLMLHLST